VVFAVLVSEKLGGLATPEAPVVTA